MKMLDEDGADAYYEDWLWSCEYKNQKLVASNGQRVTTALALRIAADFLRVLDCKCTPPVLEWNDTDLRLARGAIAGLRAQGGCFGPDADALGKNEYGLMLTEVCDIAVYG